MLRLLFLFTIVGLCPHVEGLTLTMSRPPATGEELEAFRAMLKEEGHDPVVYHVDDSSAGVANVQWWFTLYAYFFITLWAIYCVTIGLMMLVPSVMHALREPPRAARRSG